MGHGCVQSQQPEHRAHQDHHECCCCTAAQLLHCTVLLDVSYGCLALQWSPPPPPPPLSFTPLATARLLGHLPHDLHVLTWRLSSCRAQAYKHSSSLIQLADLGAAKVAADGRRITQQARQEHAAADCHLDGAAPTLTRQRHIGASSHADAVVHAVHVSLLRVSHCDSLRC